MQKSLTRKINIIGAGNKNNNKFVKKKVLQYCAQSAEKNRNENITSTTVWWAVF